VLNFFHTSNFMIYSFYCQNSNNSAAVSSGKRRGSCGAPTSAARVASCRSWAWHISIYVNNYFSSIWKLLRIGSYMSLEPPPLNFLITIIIIIILTYYDIMQPQIHLLLKIQINFFWTSRHHHERGRLHDLHGGPSRIAGKEVSYDWHLKWNRQLSPLNSYNR